MNVDPEKWIRSLPNANKKSGTEKYNLDYDRWIKTIPKTNTKNSIKKYSLTLFLFVVGLFFVSVIKNETRSLQKEINNLETSIGNLEYDLHQSILDHYVITSPQNLTELSKLYLETDFIPYKKSQIRKLNKKNAILTHLAKSNDKESLNKKDKGISYEIKLKIEKKIKEKENGLSKLQEIYSKPEKLPDELRKQVANKIEKTKIELKNFYSDPKGAISSGRIQKWASIQVVKALFGLPIIPGK